MLTKKQKSLIFLAGAAAGAIFTIASLAIGGTCVPKSLFYLYPLGIIPGWLISGLLNKK